MSKSNPFNCAIKGTLTVDEVINHAYENQSLIVTSNHPFQESVGRFDDAMVVSAILDQLLHHSHLFNLKEDSYRLKDKIHPPRRVSTTN